MRSTVSMTLASACLVMMSSTAGSLLNIAAERGCAVLCVDLRHGRQPHGVPFAVLHDDRL